MEYSHQHAFEKVHFRQVTVFSFKRHTDESKNVRLQKKVQKVDYTFILVIIPFQY